MSHYYGFRPYVRVAVRHANSKKEMEKLKKKGQDIKPVTIEGKKIAKTFWGVAWCDHLESFSDYENRLPRGRSYLRNGSVCHLDITKGEVNAMVSGSALYTVKVTIKMLPKTKWNSVKDRCAGQIGSLLELLQGHLSTNVMTVVTNQENGLFPLPEEISLKCSCPDWAVMCKHVAAALYGVAVRLDEKPELLFLLRGVDHEELISADISAATSVTQAKGVRPLRGGRKRIAENALTDIFGIEISGTPAPIKKKPQKRTGKKASVSSRGTRPKRQKT